MTFKATQGHPNYRYSMSHNYINCY